jgi:uncharacterized membrane protein
MTMTTRPVSQLALSAARWPPAAALGGLIVLGAVFPERYGLLPRWVSRPLWVTLLLLVVLSTFAHASPVVRRMEGPVTRLLLALMTGLLVAGVGELMLLVLGEASELRGVPLLWTGATLWASNVVVFALWHWLLDGGGPEERLRHSPTPADLRFPRSNDAWNPTFADYVFFAFNTSVAFSPTDTSPLTGRAKTLMMTQSLLSLVTLVVVVARAINILD